MTAARASFKVENIDKLRCQDVGPQYSGWNADSDRIGFDISHYHGIRADLDPIADFDRSNDN